MEDSGFKHVETCSTGIPILVVDVQSAECLLVPTHFGSVLPPASSFAKPGVSGIWGYGE